MSKRKRTWTNEQFIDAVKTSRGIREVLSKLNLKPTGGNYKQFHQYIKEFNLDTNHFLGQGWNKEWTYSTVHKQPLQKILTVNSSYQSYKLKNRLIKEGILDRKCYNCNLKEWLGQPINIELEHKNGINTDNRLENLTLLCPNCRSYTDTYRGKNIKK